MAIHIIENENDRLEGTCVFITHTQKAVFGETFKEVPEQTAKKERIECYEIQNSFGNHDRR